MVSYTPYEPQHPELPEPQVRVKKPEELEAVEDLYLTGRFVEQLHRVGMSQTIIIQLPNHQKIALGTRKLNQKKYEEALSYFQTAGDKLNIKYYQPKEGGLCYYMGLAQKELGLDELAI